MSGVETNGDAVVIRRMDDVPAQAMAKAPAASMQVLIGPEQGEGDFILRRFTVEPGGAVPLHAHDAIEHVQVILEGEMVLLVEDGPERVVRAGDAVFLPAGRAHGYENRGKTPVRFLCTIPNREHRTAWR